MWVTVALWIELHPKNKLHYCRVNIYMLHLAKCKRLRYMHINYALYGSITFLSMMFSEVQYFNKYLGKSKTTN